MSASAAEKVYTRAADFREFVAVMHGGEVIEIDAEMFRYWLNGCSRIRNGRAARTR